jgi:hypothetical protein
MLGHLQTLNALAAGRRKYSNSVTYLGGDEAVAKHNQITYTRTPNRNNPATPLPNPKGSGVAYSERAPHILLLKYCFVDLQTSYHYFSPHGDQNLGRYIRR